jgi:putative ABC transport system ATP-binding protein
MTDRPDPAPLISLRDVHLSLGHDAGRVHILKGVGLDIAAGETVGIVGPSGSGKSTLLMVMAGLERADSGSVTIGDADLTRLSEDELARFRGRSIGIVFQSFHLIPNMTALENVAVPLELAGHADAFSDKARAELPRWGWKAGSTIIRRSSRAANSSASPSPARLSPVRRLLLADEPTGNLDEKTGAQIVDLMFSATRERGMTLVLVTHDAGLARRCDTSIRVRSGHIETVETRAAETQGA